ncbi:MAG: hypothetical protein R6X02_22880 [Enhygromyxa sp.]
MKPLASQAPLEPPAITSETGSASTVTDDLQRIDSPPRSLLDHPQRFGILPTKWFWRDNDRENWRRIRWWFFVPLLITMAAVYSTGNMLLFMTVPPVVMVLLLGLLEKYIRHRATKRRAMLGKPSNR